MLELDPVFVMRVKILDRLLESAFADLRRLELALGLGLYVVSVDRRACDGERLIVRLMGEQKRIDRVGIGRMIRECRAAFRGFADCAATYAASMAKAAKANLGNRMPAMMTPSSS